jgi:hypothetical protein
MKHAVTYTASIIGLAIGFAGSVLAQTTANGPYYATPSWDQTLPVSTRFIVLSNFGNAAVLDRETGLVWERSPSTSPLTLNNANKHCQELALGGRFGWRLPKTDELFSLLDPTQVSLGGPNAALPLGHPFQNVSGGAYWAMDRAPPPFNNAAQIIIVFLDEAGVNYTDSTDLRNLWCVRGAGGSPTPW